MVAMKTIDFTRPTKFTPDHERRLGRALAAFCRTSSTRLSAELRLPIELEFVEATQLTWANAHDRLDPSALCGVVELRPTGTQVLLGVDSAFMLTGIESLLSGAPEEPVADRRLSEIDLALARRLFEDMLDQLAVIWRDRPVPSWSCSGSTRSWRPRGSRRCRSRRWSWRSRRRCWATTTR